jgi:hypothetical protein
MIQEKPPIDEALLHFGVKGMQWGVRKERTPAQKIDKLTKKIEKIDANVALEGISLRGWSARKQFNRAAKKDPKFKYKNLTPEQKRSYDKRVNRRVKRSVLMRGAAEAAIVLGGTYGLTRAVRASPQATTGAVVSGAILAGNVGSMRIQQLRAINKSIKFEKLQEERRALGYRPD